jgi:NAD(P)-dependent dehydrogenase (short-subunit alcohol dehydrogenase family)
MRFAEQVASLGQPVDHLILNAGVMACPLARSPEGIESQLAINFVGHAVLTSKLVSALLKSDAPRVISLSSRAHQQSPVLFEDINYERHAYDPWEAYAQSKTASTLLAVKVGQELGRHGVTAHTLNPGGIRTGLTKHVTGDVAAVLSNRFKFDSSKIQVKTVPQGAATTVWAATEPELLKRNVLYLEDCGVAALLERPTYTHGVMPYAIDPDNAAALWRAAERLIDAEIPLKAN